MKILLTWLLELLPDLPRGLGAKNDASSMELAHLAVPVLDALGLSVEGVTEIAAAPAGALVVSIESVRDVPGSDHLRVATISDGKTKHEVVAGAPNTREGLRTVWAPPGTALPNPAGGEPIVIGTREMKGVKSSGMLCSAKELGIYEDKSGVIELAEDATVGRELASMWPAEAVIELELTPNRADAFSVLGVARDLAVKLSLTLRHPAAELTVPTNRGGEVRVDIADRETCPRFTARVVRGVKVGPSPLWIQRRLAHLGLRPRNIVVDVTNLLTFELGQPSHAYDLAKLQGGVLGARRAKSGEKFVSLTDATLELSDQDLVITTGADHAIPVALGGVIGGLDTSVTKETRDVALEVAHFDPVSIRKSAKRHQMITDAHYRFERGVDPDMPPLASARACQLLAQYAGGQPEDAMTDAGAAPARASFDFRPSRVEFLTHLQIPIEQQRAWLEGLGCKVTIASSDSWRIDPPSWRFDLAIEEDAVEEMARLEGYDRIDERVPEMDFVPPNDDPTHRGLRNLLAGMGLQEIIGYVFSSPEELARAKAPPPARHLANPPGQERSCLRTALYTSLLGASRTNRALPGVALFEIGHVFGATEDDRVAILVRGTPASESWLGAGSEGAERADFFTLKGLVERAALALGASLEVEPAGANGAARIEHLHPGISGWVIWEGQRIGWIGRIHPEVEAHYESPHTYAAELALPLPRRVVRFRDPVRQPHAERDVAIVAPREVAFASLAETVGKAAGERLESIVPFDVYEGSHVAEGKRSVAVRLRFRHPERALRDEEIEGLMQSVLGAIRAASWEIRG